jgi:hypothetical protein
MQKASAHRRTLGSEEQTSTLGLPQVSAALPAFSNHPKCCVQTSGTAPVGLQEAIARGP